ncbi:MAG: hypothetical protein HOM38_09015 [Euryarchaeota archaeon]|nr:hypothetical protein [Euryarchaeota archaeon]
MTVILMTIPLATITTTPRRITTVNDIDNDWIDDILAEDSPEYDDLTEDTLSDTYSGEYE